VDSALDRDRVWAWLCDHINAVRNTRFTDDPGQCPWLAGATSAK